MATELANGRLLRASSHSRLQDEVINTNGQLIPGSIPINSGYYTPQPAKKALKPSLAFNKSQIAQKPHTSPVVDNGHDVDANDNVNVNKESKPIPSLVTSKRTGAFENSRGNEPGISSASFENTGSDSVKRALKPPQSALSKHSAESTIPSGPVAPIAKSPVQTPRTPTKAAPPPPNQHQQLLKSLLATNALKKSKESGTLPVKRAGDRVVGPGVGDAERGVVADRKEKTNISPRQVDDSFKINKVRQKSGSEEADLAPRYSPFTKKGKFHSNSDSLPPPSPTGSGGGGSPSRPAQPHGNKSSLSSLVTMPKSLAASSELLNHIILSERGSHKKIKAIVGFVVGIIFGGLLLLGLYYGLEYQIYAALIITAISTIFMALCLAFTVRARCVAMLMVPTICTSRGRAALLTFIVTLLLRGPIHNIFLNSNEVSDSISCSAQLAYNQTRELQDATQLVLDAYVDNLRGTVERIQDNVEQLQHVFEPVEAALRVLNEGVDTAGRALSEAGATCNRVINSAQSSCTSLNVVYSACQDIPFVSCGALDISGVCSALNGDTCRTPNYINTALEITLIGPQIALQGVVDTFSADVDFSQYFENRINSSTPVEDIQEAISTELDKAYSLVGLLLSFSDKLLALSFVWLCVKSYLYHSSYRTNDKFDNQYVTAQFTRLDESRREGELPHLLPLKRSERNDLVDVTSLRLSKKEKGYFKFGLSTVILHSIIAGLLMLMDFGLYWLLTKIQEHGDVQIQSSGEAGTEFDIGGTGLVADLIRELFSDGFKATTAFNTTLNSTICLPKPMKPNDRLAIIISILYVLTVVMVLSQAYALRLQRIIAAYYYPEREVERIAFLYGRTLQKRNTLTKMLRDNVQRNKKEKDAINRISLTSYLSIRYPCCKSLFSMCGVQQQECLGCSSPDDGLMVYCCDRSCDGIYCEDCAAALGGKCSICEDTINMGAKVPREDEHKF